MASDGKARRERKEKDREGGIKNFVRVGAQDVFPRLESSKRVATLSGSARNRRPAFSKLATLCRAQPITKIMER